MELEAELWAQSSNPIAQLIGSALRIISAILGFKKKGFLVIYDVLPARIRALRRTLVRSIEPKVRDQGRQNVAEVLRGNVQTECLRVAE